MMSNSSCIIQPVEPEQSSFFQTESLTWKEFLKQLIPLDIPESIKTDCPIGIREAERLRELERYNLMDSNPAEECFDRITKLAAKSLNVRMCAISIIDGDRVWCKSNYGISTSKEQAGYDLPRTKNLFCSWGLVAKQPFVIANAVTDSRFADHPFVKQNPFVKCYAGVPIITNGHRLGTLCVLDTTQRTFNEEEIGTLQDYAQIIAQAVELRLKDMYTTYEKNVLAEDKKRLIDAINRFPDGLIMWNPNTHVIFFSTEGFERITGYSSDEVKGLKRLDFLKGEDTDVTTYSTFTDCFKTEITTPLNHFAFEMIFYKKDKKPFWSYIQVTKITNSDDQISTCIGLLADRSERKQQEVEMKKAKIFAENSLKAKSQFLAKMSHEFLTPLNAIVCSSSLLLENSLEYTNNTKSNSGVDEAQDLLGVVKRSSVHLLKMVNDVLDINGIENNALKLQFTSFHIKTMIDDLINEKQYGDECSKKNLEWKMVFNKCIPSCKVLGDENRIKQILAGLIDNAIKFTEKGYVSLEINSMVVQDARRKHKDFCQIDFLVTDTGIGIEDENKQIVFEMFEQIDEGITRKWDGVGMSLPLCRLLARLMKGEVWVSSVYGSGSKFCFSVTVELLKDDKDKIEHTNSVETTKKIENILVADDNLVNQKIIIKLLNRLGYNADQVINGLEAVQAVKRKNYDVVLMDLHMPVMGGLEATAKIKEMEDRNRTKVIAVTADVVDGIQQKCRDVGMEGYICKPITSEKLKNLLTNLSSMYDINVWHSGL